MVAMTPAVRVVGIDSSNPRVVNAPIEIGSFQDNMSMFTKNLILIQYIEKDLEPSEREVRRLEEKNNKDFSKDLLWKVIISYLVGNLEIFLCLP